MKSTICFQPPSYFLARPAAPRHQSFQRPASAAKIKSPEKYGGFRSHAGTPISLGLRFPAIIGWFVMEIPSINRWFGDTPTLGNLHLAMSHKAVYTPIKWLPHGEYIEKPSTFCGHFQAYHGIPIWSN
jgi:hypothetical protein